MSATMIKKLVGCMVLALMIGTAGCAADESPTGVDERCTLIDGQIVCV